MTEPTPELDEVVAILDQVMPLIQSLDHYTYQMAYAQGLLAERRSPYGLHLNDLRRIRDIQSAAAIGLGRWPSSVEQFRRHF